MTKKTLATILIVLVLAFAIAGCSKQVAPADTTTSGQQAAVDQGISEVDTITEVVEDDGLDDLDNLEDTLNNW